VFDAKACHTNTERAATNRSDVSGLSSVRIYRG
jgi:hypothetical protein